MSIGLDEVLHVAKLAELAVREDELRRLVDQMNRIVDYVATLDQVPADRIADAIPGRPGMRCPPRGRGGSGAAGPAACSLAPEFADGFFLVPRHGAMEDQ